MINGASSALHRPARGRGLASVLAALCASATLAQCWLPPASAAPSSAGAPVSEQACIAAGARFLAGESINGPYVAGQTFALTVSIACAGSPGAPPVEDLPMSASVSPVGLLELVSGAHASTSASGAVTFKVKGLKGGQATVQVSIDDGGLCMSKLGEANCSWSLKVKEQPAMQNPAHNAPLTNADWDPPQCTPPGSPGTLRYNTGLGCSLFYLKLINKARAAEHVPPAQLPTDWAKLTIAEQLFVTADLERVGRGLPPYVGLSSSLNTFAQAAAEAGEDPSAPSKGIYGAGSNESPDSVSATDADYRWMYVDGYGGNSDCATPHALGCWGHRDNILGVYTGLECTDCVMGAGSAFPPHVKGVSTSVTELFVEPISPSTFPTYFTWAKDVVPYLKS